MVVVAFFVVFVISVFVCFFFSQNVTPLIKTALNSGLSFIKHVDCGRGVSKEAHKVLIEKTKKKYRFLLLASEMGIMLSGKHAEVNGSICNRR